MGIKAKIASLVVELTANAATFNSELRDSQATARDWGAEVKTVATAGGAALAAGAAVGTAALAAMAAQSMENIDALTNHADRLGMTTEALAQLQHHASKNGMEMEEMNGSLQTMVELVSEAAVLGTGAAAEAMDEMRMSAEAMNSMSPDQMFNEIAESLSNVENANDRLRLSILMFGDEGAGMVNVVRGGAEAIAEAAAEADALGLSISRIDAAKIEAALEAGEMSAKVFEGLGNTLAIAVAPYIEAIQMEFVESAVAANGFRDVVSTGMAVTATAVGLVADTIHGMKAVWLGVQLAAATFVAATLSNLELLYQGVAKVAGVLPGLNGDIDQNSGIALWARNARIVANGLGEDLRNLAMQEMPSNKVQQWFIDIEQQAEASARDVANYQESITKKSAKSRLVALNNQLMMETETVQQSFERREDLAKKAFERNKKVIDGARAHVSQQLYSEAMANNLAAYQSKLAEIAEEKAKLSANDESFTSDDVDRLHERLTAQNETIAEAYRRRELMLINTLAANQISEERYMEVSKLNYASYQQDLAKQDEQRLRQKEAADRISLQMEAQLNSNMMSLGHGLAGQNKKLQMAMLAIDTYMKAKSAIISGYEAGMKAAAALAGTGPQGPALAAAANAKMVTMGYASAAAIAANGVIQGMGAGGGSSSGGSSASTPSETALPNTAATIASIPGAAERRAGGESVVVMGNIYTRAIQAIDTESFAQAAMRNKSAIAEATEAELNEYGRTLVS